MGAAFGGAIALDLYAAAVELAAVAEEMAAAEPASLFQKRRKLLPRPQKKQGRTLEPLRAEAILTH